MNKQEKAEYMKNWRQVHQKEIKTYSKIYWDTHKEERKAYCQANQDKIKAWRIVNSEKLKILDRKNYLANREKRKKQASDWQKNNPEQHKICVVAWQHANPERVKINNKIWAQNNPEKRKAIKAKRRSYGYNMLNVYFPGSVGHHVNNKDVVFIPEKIHFLGFAGPSRQQLHRDRVMKYYGNLDNMIHGRLVKQINEN